MRPPPGPQLGCIPCELTLTLQKHQPQKTRSVGSCRPSARSHPAPAARLLSLQPKAFKFWEIKQQNKQTNEQKSKKEGERRREGSWGRWYWPITVRRFCTGIGKRRRWETVAIMAPVALGVGTGGSSSSTCLLYPILHPSFTAPLTPHPCQTDPAPSALQSPEGSLPWPQHLPCSPPATQGSPCSCGFFGGSFSGTPFFSAREDASPPALNMPHRVCVEVHRQNSPPP